MTRKGQNRRPAFFSMGNRLLCVNDSNVMNKKKKFKKNLQLGFTSRHVRLLVCLLFIYLYFINREFSFIIIVIIVRSGYFVRRYGVATTAIAGLGRENGLTLYLAPII